MSRFAVALLSLFLFQGTVQAQAYPARSVKIIVPFGAGGSADVYARFIGAKLSDSLGQPFVVENRPGAGAVVGSDAVAKSAPDGYTLLLHADSGVSINPHVYGKLPTTVIIVTTTAVYTQCPKALIRSHLWDSSRHREASELPSVGDIMELITAGAFDGKAHDAAYPERVRQTIY